MERRCGGGVRDGGGRRGAGLLRGPGARCRPRPRRGGALADPRRGSRVVVDERRGRRGAGPSPRRRCRGHAERGRRDRVDHREPERRQEHAADRDGDEQAPARALRSMGGAIASGGGSAGARGAWDSRTSGAVDEGAGVPPGPALARGGAGEGTRSVSRADGGAGVRGGAPAGSPVGARTVELGADPAVGADCGAMRGRRVERVPIRAPGSGVRAGLAGARRRRRCGRSRRAPRRARRRRRGAASGRARGSGRRAPPAPGGAADELRDARDGRPDDLHDHLVRVAVEGPLAGEHLEEHHPERPDVGAVIEIGRGERLLRAHVRGRADREARRPWRGRRCARGP